jgi:tetratricopeptide (TPR) repeat protein
MTSSKGTTGVVGFIARSRDRLLIPRKLARWRDQPSPAALADAVQTLLRLEDVDKAWATARQGYARYKDDELVREMWRIAGRAHAEQGVALAQQEVLERPTANAFLKLARFSVLLRDVEAALRALEECLRRFPTSAAAHAALAELLEQRWLRDLAAADGRAVLSHLRKAWRLDGVEATRPLRLAAFLARVGAVREALAVTEEVLHLHGEHDDAKTLRDSLARIVASGVEAGTIDPDLEEDVESLLRQIEESGRVLGDPGDAARVARESDRMRSYLPAFRERSGCEQVLVLEPKGDALDERGALGASPMTSLAANLARSAQITVRRLDLGPLRSVAMETTGGSLLLQRAQRCMVGALIDEPDAVEAGRAALEQLVAGRLPASPLAAARVAPGRPEGTR